MTATNPFVIERTLNAPPLKVWKAITENDQMKQWYFKLKEFKAEVGFEFSFEGGPPGKIYVHLCKVTEVINGKKITYSWKFKGYEGISYVTWELIPDGNRTLLRLTHSGLESFPKIPDFAPENFAQGWTDIIGRSLKEFVEK